MSSGQTWREYGRTLEGRVIGWSVGAYVLVQLLIQVPS